MSTTRSSAPFTATSTHFTPRTRSRSTFTPLPSIPEGLVAASEPTPHRFAPTTKLRPFRDSAKSGFTRPRELERYTLPTQDADLAALFASNREGVITALEEKVGADAASDFRYWSEDPDIPNPWRLTDKRYDQRRLGLIISRMMQDITSALTQDTRTEGDIYQILRRYDWMRKGDDPVIRDIDIPASLQNPTYTRTLLNLGEEELEQIWAHALRCSLSNTADVLASLGVSGLDAVVAEPKPPTRSGGRLLRRARRGLRRRSSGWGAGRRTAGRGMTGEKLPSSTSIADCELPKIHDSKQVVYSASGFARSALDLTKPPEYNDALDDDRTDDSPPVRDDTDKVADPGETALAGLAQISSGEAKKKGEDSADQSPPQNGSETDMAGKVLIALSLTSIAAYGLTKWLGACPEEEETWDIYPL